MWSTLLVFIFKDNIMIITFNYDTKYGIYSDALYLDDNHSFTDNEIESMKQERLKKWILFIETPPVQNINNLESTVD